jgi:hypothetical protein
MRACTAPLAPSAPSAPSAAPTSRGATAPPARPASCSWRRSDAGRGAGPARCRPPQDGHGEPRAADGWCVGCGGGGCGGCCCCCGCCGAQVPRCPGAQVPRCRASLCRTRVRHPASTWAGHRSPRWPTAPTAPPHASAAGRNAPSRGRSGAAARRVQGRAGQGSRRRRHTAVQRVANGASPRPGAPGASGLPPPDRAGAAASVRPPYDTPRDQQEVQAVKQTATLRKKPPRAQSSADAGWRACLDIRACKPVGAGTWAVAVPPAESSQRGAGWGELVDNGFSVRWHACPMWGTSLQRDHPAPRKDHRTGRAGPIAL